VTGEVVMRVVDDELFIERADPVVEFSCELLDGIGTHWQGFAVLDGDLLTITASNRTVRYRLGPKPPEWSPESFTYRVRARVGQLMEVEA